MRHRPHRQPSRMPVRIGGESGSIDALLVNVCRWGARLKGLPGRALATGSTVTMTASGLSPQALMRWRANVSGQLGLDLPVAALALARLRQSPDANARSVGQECR